jgi:hypothetical protein
MRERKGLRSSTHIQKENLTVRLLIKWPLRHTAPQVSQTLLDVVNAKASCATVTRTSPRKMISGTVAAASPSHRSAVPKCSIPVAALPSRPSAKCRFTRSHRRKSPDSRQAPHTGRLVDGTAPAVKNRWAFMQQQQRIWTFRQGAETARVSQEAEENESMVD